MNVFPPSQFFPPAEAADRRGLIGFGGELTPQWLIDAYRHGIFPWPTQDGMLAWWSPDPRAVIEFDQLHVSHRLMRTIRSGRFRATCDRAFAAVMQGCATAQDRSHATWITPEVIAAYQRLHRLGVAHSVEVWHAGELAGGVYGVAFGAMFAAESMFYAERDASKVALVHLVDHLRARGYQLLDIQQLTAHTARLGATTIPRQSFLDRVVAAIDQPVSFGDHLEVPQDENAKC
jgi:leucyl/phenylalanyl-tRNA--protein transferase